MQLHFTGRNIEVTPALKTFTAEKMERVEHRYSSITNMNVIFHIENLDHIAEATTTLHGVELHATARAEDMYKAIDALADKLLVLLAKHKEKNSGHR